MNTSNDELESRFISKRQAWEQGYQDGQVSVQHDLNLVEQQAAAQALEEVLELVWVEVQSCGVSREVFAGITANIRAKSPRRTGGEPR